MTKGILILLLITCMSAMRLKDNTPTTTTLTTTTPTTTTPTTTTPTTTPTTTTPTTTTPTTTTPTTHGNDVTTTTVLPDNTTNIKTNDTTSTTTDVPKKPTEAFVPKIKVDGQNISIENCHAYAANAMFINFGCNECLVGHKLLADASGIGVCRKETGILNCNKSIQFTSRSKITCLECLNGYALSTTGGKCTKLDIEINPSGNTSEIIPNCKQYSINSIGTITCTRCISGFSLSDKLTNCSTKCKITNCDTCYENNKSQFCNSCSAGYVGLIGFPFNSISKCITAKEWMDSIFNPLVKEYILNDH